jgi:hypothetical protein
LFFPKEVPCRGAAQFGVYGRPVPKFTLAVGR